MDPLAQIPFTYVGAVTKANLARKLDIFNPNGKDWRGLADYLDFTADEIEHIRALTHSGSNTDKLFENYIRADGNSVGQVLNSLQKLGREDVYKILQDNLQEIIGKYERKTGRRINMLSRQASFGSPTDNRIQPGYPMPSGPVVYPSVQSPMVGTQFSYQSLAHASAPVFMQGRNDMSGNNWNIPPPADTPTYDSLRNDSKQYDSMNPNVHRSASYRGEDIEMNELSTSCDSTGPMHRTDTGTLSFIEGLARGENQIVSVNGQSEFGSLGNMGPPVQMLRSDTFFGQPKHEPRLSGSEEQYVQEGNQSLDEETRRKVEEWLRGVKPGNPDEPKQTMTHSRESASTHRGVRATGKHKLSQSDENGEPSKKFSSARDNYIKRGKLGSRSNTHGVRQGLLRNRDSLEPLHEQERNTPRHSTPETQRVRSSPWLESDEQCYSGEHLKSDPTTSRPTCTPHPERRSKHYSWPESKTEEYLRMKTKPPPNFNAHQMPSVHPRVTQTQNEHYQNRSRSNPQSPAPIVLGQGQTEDIDMVSTDTRNQQDVEQMLRQFKAMSVSMPNGMKPATHNEGKRKIRVFITYSQDDKRHTQRVINLCDCLRKNNFQPCIDMFEKVKIAQDKHGWIDKKFKEADFVFVVISPQYKRDADRSSEFENGEQITYHGLHTRYIYRLMQNEYTNNMCKNYRFVPLIFHASSATKEHVPEWLQNTLIYSWPKQFKDLFFHILSSKQNEITEQSGEGT